MSMSMEDVKRDAAEGARHVLEQTGSAAEARMVAITIISMGAVKIAGEAFHHHDDETGVNTILDTYVSTREMLQSIESDPEIAEFLKRGFEFWEGVDASREKSEGDDMVAFTGILESAKAFAQEHGRIGAASYINGAALNYARQRFERGDDAGAKDAVLRGQKLAAELVQAELEQMDDAGRGEFLAGMHKLPESTALVEHWDLHTLEKEIAKS